MGHLLDYFIAPSAEDASLALVGGPTNLVDGSAFPVLGDRWMLDPTIGLASVDEILTNRGFFDVIADPSAQEFVDPDGNPSSTLVDLTGTTDAMVVSVSTLFQDALVATPDDELRAIAAAACDSGADLMEPDDATETGDFLVDLAAFVRDGRAKGGRLYAWWSP